MRHRAIMTNTLTRMDRNRHRVQGFKFVYDGTEIGKRGNAFAFEFVFPSNRLDDLADNLSQPTQRMGFVKRDRIGGRRQEVAAFADQRLQVEFNGLPVEQDGRTSIPRRLRVRFQVQCCDERFSGFVQRSSIKTDFDIAAVVPAVVPGSFVALEYCLRSAKSKDGWLLLLHRCAPLSSLGRNGRTAKPNKASLPLNMCNALAVS